MTTLRLTATGWFFVSAVLAWAGSFLLGWPVFVVTTAYLLGLATAWPLGLKAGADDYVRMHPPEHLIAAATVAERTKTKLDKTSK